MPVISEPFWAYISVNCGTTYSKMIAGLKKANVSINRKMLAEIAVSDPKAFTEIAEMSKKA